MNVLLVQPYGERKGHFCGYTARLGQELVQLGHRVTVVTTKLEWSSTLDFQPQFRIEEVGARGFSFDAGKGVRRRFVYAWAVMGNNIRTLRKFLSLCRGEVFDAVHLIDFECLSTGLFLGFLHRFSPVRVPNLFAVIHPADFSFARYKRIDPAKGAYKAVAGIILKRLVRYSFQAAVVHGDWHKRELLRQLRLLESDKLVVVPYGTEVPAIVLDRKVARAHLGLHTGEPLFLLLGTLRRDKAVDVVIRGFAETPRASKLLIAGPPADWSEEELRKLIREFRCEDRVVLHLRYVPEKESVYYVSACDAVILPYARHYAGNSGPLAMTCGYGRPVLASSVGDTELLVRGHGLGIVFLPDDAESFRGAIEAFLRMDTVEKEQIAKRGREYAVRCSWANMARRFSEIYMNPSGLWDSADRR